MQNTKRRRGRARPGPGAGLDLPSWGSPNVYFRSCLKGSIRACWERCLCDLYHSSLCLFWYSCVPLEPLASPGKEVLHGWAQKGTNRETFYQFNQIWLECQKIRHRIEKCKKSENKWFLIRYNLDSIRLNPLQLKIIRFRLNINYVVYKMLPIVIQLHTTL